jgi:hypothetical protein
VTKANDVLFAGELVELVVWYAHGVGFENKVAVVGTCFVGDLALHALLVDTSDDCEVFCVLVD